MNQKKDFNPNAAAKDGAGIFGLPYQENESLVVYLPVPWDVTTSYRPGASLGPDAILDASYQMDLFDLEIERPYSVGYYLKPSPAELKKLNKQMRKSAEKILATGGEAPKGKAGVLWKRELDKINKSCEKMNQWVYRATTQVFQDGRIPVVIGGDHSVPFGAIKAAANYRNAKGKFGVLHFDAHSDTREAYEGFQWSHASIMYNVLKHVPGVDKLVQVGIRDFCEAEMTFCQSQGERVSVFYDRELQRRKMEGESWLKIAKTIVDSLPEQVWISFDIDGLDPRFCPNTGTPVPGGLEFAEATALIREVARSGRKIIGADLNEVAPSESHRKALTHSSKKEKTYPDQWDANVGMRLLYQMTGWLLVSQEKVRMRW